MGFTQDDLWADIGEVLSAGLVEPQKDLLRKARSGETAGEFVASAEIGAGIGVPLQECIVLLAAMAKIGKCK